MDTSITRRQPAEPSLFQPHPHLADEINRAIIQSEIEGGVDLKLLPPGAMLDVWTENTHYTIEWLGEGDAMISGHKTFCPTPTRVRLSGSTWGGSLIRRHFIGRGMHLEFVPPSNRPIVTSKIRDVAEAKAPAGGV